MKKIILTLCCMLMSSNIWATPIFYGSESFNVGDIPQSVAIGDLNGENGLDLVVANYWDDNVSVLLGNGDGRFKTAVNYSAGAGPISVAIADLNNNGELDLVVVNYADNNVSVLMGNGDGTFGTAVYYSAGDDPTSVAIAKLNSDDWPDLVVTNSSNDDVSVLLGNGGGAFEAAVNYSVGEEPTSVAIGKLNSDDWPDLAVVNSSSDNVSVLLGDENGTFGTATFYDVGLEPTSVAIGKLNSDDWPDLVVTNYIDNNVSVLLGDGTGTFGAAANYAAGYEPTSVAIGKLNNDDWPDLAVANSGDNDVSVLLGDGTGTFGLPVNYGAGVYPVSVAIADLNGNGELDLALVNEDSDNVSVLLGKGDGTLQVAVNYDAGSSPYSVAVADFNGDDEFDLTVANFYSDDVSVLMGSAAGDGTFQAAVPYVAGEGPTAVAAADFNGDDEFDLTVTNYVGNDVSVLLGNGDGTFQAASEYDVGNAPTSVAVGNLDGENGLDLAVANEGSANVSVLLGNGDGTFQAAVSYDTEYGPSAVAMADLDDENGLDLIVANFTSDSVSVLLGNGDGTFQAAENYDVGDGPAAVVITDFNNDTKPDLAVANSYGNTISVLLGNGDGMFQAAVDYGAGASPLSIATDDFNNDGRPDLAVADSNGNNVLVLLGKGDGQFQPAVTYGVGGDPFSFAIADFNHDTKPDLAVANNSSDNVSVLINSTEPDSNLPVTPSLISPSDGATGVELPLTLFASSFEDPDSGDTHFVSRWQVDNDADFSSLVWSATDTDSDLTSQDIPADTLASETTYYGRVRYQNNRGAWSGWSTANQFTTDCIDGFYYRDDDTDGYGDPAVSIEACNQPSGYVADNTDCDDTDPNNWASCATCVDADTDTWFIGCDAYVSINGPDCFDNDPANYPGNTEICDGQDNDCDTLVDDADGDVTGQSTWYADTDSDTHGDPAVSTGACNQPSGHVADNTDCDDGDAAAFPGATEVPDDGIDQDCSGSDTITCIVDEDQDGYGTDAGTTTLAADGSCDTAEGESTTSDDCNDGDDAVHPGATDFCNNIDDDCDGLIDAQHLTDYWSDGVWEDIDNAEDGDILTFAVVNNPDVNLFVEHTYTRGGKKWKATYSSSGPQSTYFDCYDYGSGQWLNIWNEDEPVNEKTAEHEIPGPCLMEGQPIKLRVLSAASSSYYEGYLTCLETKEGILFPVKAKNGKIIMIYIE